MISLMTMITNNNTFGISPVGKGSRRRSYGLVNENGEKSMWKEFSLAHIKVAIVLISHTQINVMHLLFTWWCIRDGLAWQRNIALSKWHTVCLGVSWLITNFATNEAKMEYIMVKIMKNSILWSNHYISLSLNFWNSWPV